MLIDRVEKSAEIGPLKDEDRRVALQKPKNLVKRDKRRTVGEIHVDNPRMTCRNADVYYGNKQAIQDVSLDTGQNEVIAMIGPSGCNKSTFLRCLNRINDTIDICRVSGEIKLDGQDIYDKQIDVVPLRVQVGMVFQKPNPFPKSIYDNIAYGPRIHGLAQNKAEMDQIVERLLKRRVSGKKFVTVWTSQAPDYRVDSSSVCALPVPLPSTRK